MLQEPPTVRNEELDMEPLPEPVEVLVPFGLRHRCTLCHQAGKHTEADFICHHCGRTFCQACAPRLSRLLLPFFEHDELKWLEVRGQYVSPADRTLGNAIFEPAHCPYHVHYTPRRSAWIALFATALLLGLLLAVLQDNALLSLLLPLFYILAAGGVLYWQKWMAQQSSAPFFPVSLEHPLLELRENFEADAVLDRNGYIERWSDEDRRGLLRATIKLEPELSEALYRLQDAHELDDYALAVVPATAGTVVLESVHRVQSPMPVWPDRNARRWDLSAPLPEWPLIWGGQGPWSKILEFRYGIGWQIPRLPFNFAFPVQLQAHFPERGDRRTLELLYLLSGPMRNLAPFFQECTVEAEARLPAFRLLPVQGRPMSGTSDRFLRIEDLAFAESGVARVLLRFEEEIAYGQAAWLSGRAIVGFIGTLSGMRIDGYYDAYGQRVRSPAIETISRATLRFRVDVGALPYQSTGRASCEVRLRGASALRDDAVVRALDERTHLVHVHERMYDTLTPYHRAPGAAPIRELMGHWPEKRLTEMNPVVYHVHILPYRGYTRVSIHVEAPVSTLEFHSVQASRICEELSRLITRADEQYRHEAASGDGT